MCSPGANRRKKCRNKASRWCIAVFVSSLTCTMLAAFICYPYNGEVDASSLGDKRQWQCSVVWFYGPHTESSTSLSIGIVEHDDPSVCMSWEVYKATFLLWMIEPGFEISSVLLVTTKLTNGPIQMQTLLLRSICILSGLHPLTYHFCMTFFKQRLLHVKSFLVFRFLPRSSNTRTMWWLSSSQQSRWMF